MNNKFLIIKFLVITFFSIFSAIANEPLPLADANPVHKVYLFSALEGAFIGTCTGSFTAFMDNIIPNVWRISWMAEYGGRELIINSLVTDLRTHNIFRKKSIMQISGHIASWVSYYLVYKKIAGKSPFKNF